MEANVKFTEDELRELVEIVKPIMETLSEMEPSHPLRDQHALMASDSIVKLIAQARTGAFLKLLEMYVWQIGVIQRSDPADRDKILRRQKRNLEKMINEIKHGSPAPQPEAA